MTDKITIDKFIPLPENVIGRKRLYPTNQLDIGDSFFVPGKTPREIGGVYQAAKRDNIKVMVARVDGGARIWRIK